MGTSTGVLLTKEQVTYIFDKLGKQPACTWDEKTMIWKHIPNAWIKFLKVIAKHYGYPGPKSSYFDAYLENRYNRVLMKHYDENPINDDMNDADKLIMRSILHHKPNTRVVEMLKKNGKWNREATDLIQSYMRLLLRSSIKLSRIPFRIISDGTCKTHIPLKDGTISLTSKYRKITVEKMHVQENKSLGVTSRYGIRVSDVYDFFSNYDSVEYCHMQKSPLLTEIFSKKDYLLLVSKLDDLHYNDERFINCDIDIINIVIHKSYRSTIIKVLQVIYNQHVYICKMKDMFKCSTYAYPKGLKKSEHFIIIHSVNGPVEKLPALRHNSLDGSYCNSSVIRHIILNNCPINLLCPLNNQPPDYRHTRFHTGERNIYTNKLIDKEPIIASEEEIYKAATILLIDMLIYRIFK